MDQQTKLALWIGAARLEAMPAARLCIIDAAKH